MPEQNSEHPPAACAPDRARQSKGKGGVRRKNWLSIVNGYSFIDHHSWEAYNEALDLSVHIDLFEKRFGTKPKRFFGDKIYLNRDNRKKLKQDHIEIMGAPLGRPPKDPPPEQIQRERIGTSLRNEAEAQFGTGKRVYRANNIRAKLPETADTWTAMCYFVKNVTKFMRELCRILSEICRFLRHFCSEHLNLSISGCCRDGLQPNRVVCSELAV